MYYSTEEETSQAPGEWCYVGFLLQWSQASDEGGWGTSQLPFKHPTIARWTY